MKIAVIDDERPARKMLIRRVVFIIVLFVLGSRPQIDAVAMIIGALGLKAGALCQPIVHRTFFSGR